MGTSVATELLARDLEGRFGFELAGALLFNGSIVLDRGEPDDRRSGCCAARSAPLFARLGSERVFRQQLGAVFSEAHPLSDAEAADQWALLCANGGRTLGHRLVDYLDERERYAERWHGAIRDWPGAAQPHLGIGTRSRPRRCSTRSSSCGPAAPLERLAGLGHYPQIEDPAAIGEAIAWASR